jgi:hypothetical protein
MQTKVKELFYKKGKRYKEFVKIDSFPGDTLYYKEHDEFVPMCEETISMLRWNGRPASGIWKVTPTSGTKIAELNASQFRIDSDIIRDELVQAIVLSLDTADTRRFSIHELAIDILDNLCKVHSEVGEE